MSIEKFITDLKSRRYALIKARNNVRLSPQEKGAITRDVSFLEGKIKKAERLRIDGEL